LHSIFYVIFNFQPFQKVLSNVKVVSERLGHSSASMTLGVYSPVTPDMQKQAAQKFAKPLQKKSVVKMWRINVKKSRFVLKRD
jgi:hypothetical protein